MARIEELWREIPGDERKEVIGVLREKGREGRSPEAYRRACALLIEAGIEIPPGARRVPFSTTLREDAKTRLEAEASRRGLHVNQLIEDLIAQGAPGSSRGPPMK